MRLPLPTDYTVHTFLIPSKKETKRFRPFTVKENKALLTAQSVDDIKTMTETLKLVVQQCCLDEIDVDALATFDLEYLLVKLRAISVASESYVTVVCSDPHEGFEQATRETDIVIDLNKVEVVGLDNYTQNIRLSDSMVVIMKSPSADILGKLIATDSDNYEQYFENAIHNMLVSIDKICTEDEVFDADDLGERELREWLESLTQDMFEKLYHYFESFPHCRIKLEWTCPHCGKRNVSFVQGLSYFF